MIPTHRGVLSSSVTIEYFKFDQLKVVTKSVVDAKNNIGSACCFKVIMVFYCLHWNKFISAVTFINVENHSPWLRFSRVYAKSGCLQSQF